MNVEQMNVEQMERTNGVQIERPWSSCGVSEQQGDVLQR